MLLADEGVLSARVADDGVTRVYGLQPGHIQVRCLDEGEVHAATLNCDTCHWEQVVPPERAVTGRRTLPALPLHGGRRPAGQPGPPGSTTTVTYRPGRRAVPGRHGRTHRRADPQPARAGRARFRDGHRYSDPNVLACTPTLELGIDIGDLSAVILASLPRDRQLRAAGRPGGRRSGNAFLVTFVGRRARGPVLPRRAAQMIAGEIVPPGSYLSAMEILRRQYTAHLADLCAAGRLPGVLPMPRRASALFGETGWLAGSRGRGHR